MPKLKLSLISLRVTQDTHYKLFRVAKRNDTTVSILLRSLIDALIEDRVTVKQPKFKGILK